MTESEPRKAPLFVGLSVGALAYQACVIDVRGDTISVVKNYSVFRDTVNWSDFVETVKQDFPDRDIVTALDYDDSCVGFYRFEIPAMNEKQIPSVVASQAEIHFPLPIEQMRYCWQILDEGNDKTAIAVAAAKETMLAETLCQARELQADLIVLRSEAILRAVHFLFDDFTEDFNLLVLCEDGPKLLFVQNGKLAKVTTFDCDCLLPIDEQSSQALLLCLDIQNVIDQDTARKQSPLWVLEYGGAAIAEKVQELLNNKGIESHLLQYDNCVMSPVAGVEPEVPGLGAALIASDTSSQYDLFEGLYCKAGSEAKVHGGRKRNLLAVAVGLLLVVLIVASYGADRVRLAAYEKQMNTSEFSHLQEVHHLRTMIAQQRIDVPDLIGKINQSLPKGVVVHSLSLQRSQRITVGASSKDPKMMYGFAEALGNCQGVESVRILKQNFDEKKKQTMFALTFDYKHFTQKRKISK